MKKKQCSFIGAIGLMASLLLLTACTGPLTMKDSGRTLELPIDGGFEVELAGNMTTGYSWTIASCDEHVVRSLGEPTYAADSDKLGAGGLFTFKFQAVSAGETEVVLVYHRPWEKEMPPAKTFSVKIISGTMGRIEAE